MSIFSIFTRTVDLGTMLSDVMKDNENAPGVLVLKENYKNKQVFINNLFMEMVKFYFFVLDLEDEYYLKRTIEKNKSFPEVEAAKKKLKIINEKFSFENLTNLYDQPDVLMLKEMKEHFYPILKEDWMFQKLLEAKFGVILLAGIGLRKKVDYSKVLKVANTPENKFIITFLIEYAYKMWKLSGYPVNNKYKIIVYEDMMTVRLIHYADQSVLA